MHIVYVWASGCGMESLMLALFLHIPSQRIMFPWKNRRFFKSKKIKASFGELVSIETSLVWEEHCFEFGQWVVINWCFLNHHCGTFFSHPSSCSMYEVISYILYIIARSTSIISRITMTMYFWVHIKYSTCNDK